MEHSDSLAPNVQGPDERNRTINVENNPESVNASNVLGKTPIYQNVEPTADFWERLGVTEFTFRRTDYYGNAIPIGSFCYAIAFILYGFYRAKVHTDINSSMLWALVFYFGAIGQLTAGILELTKGRVYIYTTYLVYGSYCLSHYVFFYLFKTNTLGYEILNFENMSICLYYIFWALIVFALILVSGNVNYLFLGQNLFAFIAFLMCAVGNGQGSLHTMKNSMGILQIISGFFSLLICIQQLINNETFKQPIIPILSSNPNNIADRIQPTPKYLLK